MIDFYDAVKTQMDLDVRDAFNYASGDKVLFGCQRRPVSTYPNTVIELQPVQRVRNSEDSGPRIVLETFIYHITSRWRKLDVPDETTHERFKVLQADALIMKLAPFSTSAVPAPAGRYADVGMNRMVSEFAPGEEADSDNFIEINLAFSIQRMVYQ